MGFCRQHTRRVKRLGRCGSWLGWLTEAMPVEDPTPRDVHLVEGVMRWWGDHARDLPWRSTREPWAILVSEAMAQQTQVARVIPAWTRFLERFPTPTVTAAAPAGAVVEAWAGLGYNRRAVQLHACAAGIVERHDGRVPDELEQLLALPGVGPYTASAVLALAFEHAVAVLDTNVGRILARWEGRELGRAEAQLAADRRVPPGKGWDWNQAVLDFGALQCTKRSPACGRCPVEVVCAWAGRGVDPAVGSAGVGGTQSRFAGSDRQGRGRLVDALRRGPVLVGDLATVMGWPGDTERAERVAESVVRDGLAVRDEVLLQLP